MMWKINREAVLLGAGPAALLLQIAHPSVAAGVAEHSTFEQDPIARLRGTLITTMDLIFGDGPAGQRRPCAGSTRSMPASVARLSSARPGAAAVGPGDADQVERGGVLALGRAAVGGRDRTVLAGGADGRHAPGHSADLEPGRLAGTDALLGADAVRRRTHPRFRHGPAAIADDPAPATAVVAGRGRRPARDAGPGPRACAAARGIRHPMEPKDEALAQDTKRRRQSLDIGRARPAALDAPGARRLSADRGSWRQDRPAAVDAQDRRRSRSSRHR